MTRANVPTPMVLTSLKSSSDAVECYNQHGTTSTWVHFAASKGRGCQTGSGIKRALASLPQKNVSEKWEV